ncbi:MAG: hypothetical protein JXA36_04110 [Coriobacteriia bacterium]|nr:hypothetical protein [Coriobacteriia bacterium]
MSDEQPVFSPTPDYSPTPAPDNYGPDTFGGSAQPQTTAGQSASPNKKKTAIIIGAIVAVVLLCCCTSAALLTFLVFKGEDDTTLTSEPSVEDVIPELPDESDAADDARLDEWSDWNPTSTSPLLAEAPVAKEALILEGLSVAAPGFTYQEAVWWEGYYDETDDWYYPDWFYVRASHPSSDDVTAAVEFCIESDEMAPLDIDYASNEGNSTTTVDGGARVLEYVPQWGAAGFTLATDDDVALWKQIGRDWPDAVVVEAREGADGPNYFEVDITKWSLYVVDGSYPAVWLTYKNVGGEWSLVSWEYVSADGTTESPSSI